jgi:hypothetical protein
MCCLCAVLCPCFIALCSREKVRPKDELQRAEVTIARSKEIIRQVSFQACHTPLI